MKSLNQRTKTFAKKSLGQNFLIDDRIVSRIITACDLQPDETIVEIGPGRGALTRLLAPHVKRLIAIEKDRDLVPVLQEEFQHTHVEIVQADFLRHDLSTLPQPVKLIGNLPYNISTPILTRVIEHRHQFTQLYMTVQWEFGARLVAQKGTKDYGSMTLFTQFYSHPEILFKIPPRAFRPIPKVASCFMKIDLHQHQRHHPQCERKFAQVVRQAFQQRRKRISNALAMFAPKPILMNVFDKVGVDPQSRAEQLSLDEFIQLAEALTRIGEEGTCL